jgi:hypothetical protein
VLIQFGNNLPRRQLVETQFLFDDQADHLRGFFLLLPNQKKLAIDSKWPAVDLLGRLGAEADPEKRLCLINQIEGAVTAKVRRVVQEIFHGFESGSIQEVIYQIGGKILAEIPTISEIHLEANNRTWDTIAEAGAELGVYTEARPPFGCLGLRMKR